MEDFHLFYTLNAVTNFLQFYYYLIMNTEHIIFVNVHVNLYFYERN